MRSVLSVSQELAQRRDVNSQGTFLYRDTRPDACDERSFLHKGSRGFQERQQNLGCAATDPKRLSRAPQFALGRMEFERPKDKYRWAGSVRVMKHDFDPVRIRKYVRSLAGVLPPLPISFPPL
jgi:hypothetical protein